MDVGVALKRVEAVRRMSAELAAETDADLDAAVLAARAAGASWSQLGAALGMSGQAAHKRWKGQT